MDLTTPAPTTLIRTTPPTVTALTTTTIQSIPPTGTTTLVPTDTTTTVTLPAYSNDAPPDSPHHHNTNSTCQPLILITNASSFYSELFVSNVNIPKPFRCPNLQYKEDDTTHLFRNYCRNLILATRIFKEKPSQTLSALISSHNPAQKKPVLCNYVFFLKRNCT